MYQLNINARSQRAIKKLKKRYQQAVRNALWEIKEDPLSGKPLMRELTGRYRFKIRDYRIIYKIDELSKTVYVINVGHRSNIYG